MKDVIAALDAKRAAPRAGGDEKCARAQHAKGNLTAVVGLLILGLWSTIPIEPARAQDGDWVEPGGRYALGFQSLGWTGTPWVAHPPNIMAFVRNDSPRDDRMRICFVREEPVPNSDGVTQHVANSLIDRWTESRLAQVVGAPVSNVVHGSAGGVSLIDYRSQREGLDIIARFFMLEDGSGADLITISCGFPTPFTEEEVASVNAVLNSLRIIARDHK